MLDVEAEDPIDAVIMWVDGSDDYFVQREAEAFALECAQGKKIARSAVRHRDNGELRFLLRSIADNFSWIRNVYLVTNGQKPSYVDFSKPGIVHVTHSEIFPSDCEVPSFNTFAIESCLNRIPGLAVNYVRFSDDFFIGRPVSKWAYIDSVRRYIFSGRVQEVPSSKYQEQILRNAELFHGKLGYRPRFNFAHAPQLRNRAVFTEFERCFGEELYRTRRNRFRTAGDIISLMLYPYYDLLVSCPGALAAMDKGASETEHFIIKQKQSIGDYFQVLLGKDGSGWEGALASLVDNPPYYFNVNDSYNSAERDVVLKVFHGALESMFPNPSPWELVR